MEISALQTPTPSPASTHLRGHSPPVPSHPGASKSLRAVGPPSPAPRDASSPPPPRLPHGRRRPGCCPTGWDPRGRVPVSVPRHLRGRWQPAEHQLGRVPHSCHRTAPRELPGTRPAASGVSPSAAGAWLIPPQHHPIIQGQRDPPAGPGPRHRGTDKSPRPQALPEPHSLLFPPRACPFPLPPPENTQGHTPTAAAPTGKPPDNVTQPEIAPADARTAHPAAKL